MRSYSDTAVEPSDLTDLEKKLTDAHGTAMVTVVDYFHKTIITNTQQIKVFVIAIAAVQVIIDSILIFKLF